MEHRKSSPGISTGELEGTTQNFFPTDRFFTSTPGRERSRRRRRGEARGLKAVFFVRDFTGTRNMSKGNSWLPENGRRAA